jgi:3-oxoacyl-[acyl-carrier-protein] synthase III
MAAAAGAFGLRSLAHRLPAGVVSTAELVRSGVAPRGARLASGVRELPALGPEASILDLAAGAAREALRSAAAGAGEIGLLVFCSSSYPNLRGVSSAVWLRERLGLSCLAFGVTDAQCAGAHLALYLSQTLLAGQAPGRAALIVTADAFSKRWIPFGAFLSDGASAMVIGPGGAPNRLLATCIRNAGTHGGAYAYGEVGADVVVQDEEALRRVVKDGLLYSGAVCVAREALAQAGLTAAGVDHAIFDGFSPFYQERLSSMLEVPAAAVCQEELAARGHTGTSDVFITLKRLLERGAARPGQRVLLVSVGLGFTFASTVIEC